MCIDLSGHPTGRHAFLRFFLDELIALLNWVALHPRNGELWLFDSVYPLFVPDGHKQLDACFCLPELETYKREITRFQRFRVQPVLVRAVDVSYTNLAALNMFTLGWCQSGSRLVPSRYQISINTWLGIRLVPAWYRTRTRLVPHWSKTGLRWSMLVVQGSFWNMWPL
jgi:hypothetical protein